MANQLRVTLISTELAYIVFAVSIFCSTTYFRRPFLRTAFLFAAAQASRVPKYASPRLRPNCTRERPCSLSLFDLFF